MEIHKMLCLSTAHLTPETRKLLQQKKLNLIAYPKDAYGWFIPLPPERIHPEEPGYEITEDLCLCFSLAEDLEMSWIMFDRDGPVLTELPVFN